MSGIEVDIDQTLRSASVDLAPRLYNFFMCSTQLNMKFSINMKMPTIVGIFIFISREIFMLS